MVRDAQGLVRIPRVFIDDHEDRGLDSPLIQKVTARHYWIDPEDDSVNELVDDARYYARDVDACDRSLVLSARATLKALNKPIEKEQ